MKATFYRYMGLPIHIDDDLCVQPAYCVSDSFKRTSPQLAEDLQEWANQFFGAAHQIYKLNVGEMYASVHGAGKHEVLVMSNHSLYTLRKLGKATHLSDDIERIKREILGN